MAKHAQINNNINKNNNNMSKGGKRGKSKKEIDLSALIYDEEQNIGMELFGDELKDPLIQSRKAT